MHSTKGVVPKADSASEFVKLMEPVVFERDEFVSVVPTSEQEVVLVVREVTPFVRQIQSENHKLRILIETSKSYVKPYRG